MVDVRAATPVDIETCSRVLALAFHDDPGTHQLDDDVLPHTVTAADGSWDSGNLAPAGAFERRFDSTGTYAYLCRYHPGQTATIVVAAP